ncbi:DNA-3-methyladenine glycosylase [Plasmodium coatneyi]|uniref:DNA-3-methyladenine glycosylase II n=1 Tax=Plasmodium coatneyi TaxID=208452 RepID=A0A1B1E4R1_9APIC|nr:DNA-3-methyladenine glycosylase [Plasmodium coatneyi]ANQ09985.1 DNA-3-methyladenine glycosylase [Plasmodium coatneyi]
MQNEKKRRKRRGSLAATVSPGVTKKDSQCGILKGEATFPKSKQHKGEEEKKKKTNELEYMAYVYLLMEYFFENNEMTVLNENFYLQENVLSITETLIGHILWVYDKEKKKLYGSRITELEAYKGTEDKASHAYNNKKTNRNATMFGKGGISYVYLCYGIHNCLNIVTNGENIPDAILVRSLEPFYGVDRILLKRYKIHSGGSMLGKGSSDLSACAVKGEGGGIPIGCPDEPPHHDSNNYLVKEKLQRIEKVKAILKSINMRKLAKVCSGPGCVTKCLDITRQDDKASFFSDLPQYSREGKNISPDHCSTCNISHLQQSRFFISICPSVCEVINFYETLVAQKRGNDNYIEEVYSQYKTHLLDYFKCMKWDQEGVVVQRDKRVGVAYAQEAALYDYRFLLKGHPSISVLPK